MTDRFHREFAFLMLYALSIIMQVLIKRWDCTPHVDDWETAKSRFQGEHHVRLDS